jgi:hypothetical protein
MVGLVAAAPAALAETDPHGGHVYLSWVRMAGAESCPDVRQIADDVTGRLGWNPFRESPNQFIEAQIRRDVSWVAEIFLRDASGASRGNRVFTSNAPTCTSLASVVALSIAIIIDPDVMIRGFSDEELWSAAGTPPPDARAPHAARGVLVLLGGGGLGLLPRFAPGVGLAGEVRLAPRLALRVGGVFLPEVRTPEPDSNFAFGLSAGWLGACFDGVQREAFALGACLAGMGGVLHAVVYYPEATRPGQRPLFAATGGLRLALRLSARVEAQLGGDGVLVLNRRQFSVEGRPPGMDVVWLQPAAATLFWAALGVRFR